MKLNSQFAMLMLGRSLLAKLSRCNVLKKTAPVVFEGELVMSFTLPDQIVGDLALGQQGIGLPVGTRGVAH